MNPNPTLNHLQNRLAIKQHQAEIKSLKQNETMAFLVPKPTLDKLNKLRAEHIQLSPDSSKSPREKTFYTHRTANKEIEFFETANAKLRGKPTKMDLALSELEVFTTAQNRAGQASIEGDITESSMDRFIDKIDRLQSQPGKNSHHKVIAPAKPSTAMSNSATPIQSSAMTSAPSNDILAQFEALPDGGSKHAFYLAHKAALKVADHARTLNKNEARKAKSMSELKAISTKSKSK